MLTKEKALEVLIDKLEELFEDQYEYLFEFLVKYNAYISGNFILDEIYEKKIDDYTIDIYIDGNIRGKKFNNLEVPELIIYNSDKYVMHERKQNRFHFKNLDDDYDKFIISVITIPTHRKTLREGMMEYISMDICKNVLYIEDGFWKLDLGSDAMIYNKVCQFDVSESFQSLLHAINNYYKLKEHGVMIYAYKNELVDKLENNICNGIKFKHDKLWIYDFKKNYDGSYCPGNVFIYKYFRDTSDFIEFFVSYICPDQRTYVKCAYCSRNKLWHRSRHGVYIYKIDNIEDYYDDIYDRHKNKVICLECMENIKLKRIA